MKARSPSPYLREINDSGTIKKVLITAIPKIHRIRCRQPFNAIVTNVVSPSEIWILILNNISERLIVPSSDAPMLETDLSEHKYVLTPIDGDTLVRGRILEVEKERVLVRLIDNGLAVWRDKNAIFKMLTPKDQFFYFPWQAKHVMLHGVKPKNNIEWTAEETDAIKKVFVEFDYVYVKPSLADYFYNNDDREAMSVSMIGMNGPFQQSCIDENGCQIPPESSGMDIAELYHIQAGSSSRFLIDGRDQEFFEYPSKYEDTYRSTYKSFDIKPNPNGTYRDENVGFKPIKKEEEEVVKDKGPTYVSLDPSKNVKERKNSTTVKVKKSIKKEIDDESEV